eukprot:TRINITY_DN310_c2_g2_i1.p2 TRINITY_DN310_c2_g2~~TRINITY_DN310_c2_g2_i1.p2  ORF type:complete len:278 (-),score=105.38 TRINITY_DN310_c2_g2_i1:54-809(-)
MTTAGRPTWNPAKGSANQGGTMFVPTRAYSSRDLPGHNKLKIRQPGQGTLEELREEDMIARLQERDKTAAVSAAKPAQLLKDKGEADEEREKEKSKGKKVPEKNPDADDSDDESDSEEDDEGKDKKEKKGADADSSSSSSESDSEEEDDTEALMAELERIKKERATEQARRETDEKAKAEVQETESILHSNPLVNQDQEESSAGDFTVRKRWYEDVVFKNQTRGEPTRKKRFINDTTRNDFHLQFLKKYVR